MLSDPPAKARGSAKAPIGFAPTRKRRRRIDGGPITVKADKSFDPRDDASISVDFADASVHVFDKDTGDRPRAIPPADCDGRKRWALC